MVNLEYELNKMKYLLMMKRLFQIECEHCILSESNCTIIGYLRDVIRLYCWIDDFKGIINSIHVAKSRDIFF